MDEGKSHSVALRHATTPFEFLMKDQVGVIGEENSAVNEGAGAGEDEGGSDNADEDLDHET
jgi:hypothetical protein